VRVIHTSCIIKTIESASFIMEIFQAPSFIHTSLPKDGKNKRTKKGSERLSKLLSSVHIHYKKVILFSADGCTRVQGPLQLDGSRREHICVPSAPTFIP